jgi:hypothetical protein
MYMQSSHLHTCSLLLATCVIRSVSAFNTSDAFLQQAGSALLSRRQPANMPCKQPPETAQRITASCRLSTGHLNNAATHTRSDVLNMTMAVVLPY